MVTPPSVSALHMIAAMAVNAQMPPFLQKRLAYPLSLVFFVVVQAAMGPVAATGTWQRFLDWFAALPMFGS